jgi:hypothetical protein
MDFSFKFRELDGREPTKIYAMPFGESVPSVERERGDQVEQEIQNGNLAAQWELGDGPSLSPIQTKGQ